MLMPSFATLFVAAALALAVLPPLVQAEDSSSAAAPSPTVPSEKNVLLRGPDFTLTSADLVRALERIPMQQRVGVAADPNKLRGFIEAEYRSLAIYHQALRRGLEQDPLVQEELAQSRRQILSRALVQRQQEAVALPDLEPLAKTQYLGDPDAFRIPEQITIRHLLLRVKDPAELEAKSAALSALRERVRAGEDFAELARTYSEDTGSAAKGGDLGTVTRGKMVKPFEDAAFALQEPGELSPVVTTRFGVHLIQLVQRQPERRQDFEEVKSRLIQGLRQAYIQQKYKDWYQEVTALDADQINDEALQAAIDRLSAEYQQKMQELANTFNAPQIVPER